MPSLPKPAAAILANMDEKDRAIMEMAIAMLASGAGMPAPQPAPAPEPEAKMGGNDMEPKMSDEPKLKMEDEEDMMKRADLEKSLKVATDENVELRKRLDALEERNEAAVWLEKARTMAPRGVPGMAVEQLATVLKSARKAMGEDEFAALQTSLTASARMMEHSELLKEYGSAGDPGANGKSAEAELTKRAGELAAAEGISIEVAKGRVLKTDHNLLKRMRAEEVAH